MQGFKLTRPYRADLYIAQNGNESQKTETEPTASSSRQTNNIFAEVEDQTLLEKSDIMLRKLKAQLSNQNKSAEEPNLMTHLNNNAESFQELVSCTSLDKSIDIDTRQISGEEEFSSCTSIANNDSFNSTEDSIEGLQIDKIDWATIRMPDRNDNNRTKGRPPGTAKLNVIGLPSNKKKAKVNSTNTGGKTKKSNTDSQGKFNFIILLIYL